MINHREVIRRLIKYCIVVLLVAFASKTVPKAVLSSVEVLYIGVVAGTTFAVLDMVSPTIYIKN
jgi:hypothetical protein